LNGGHTRKVAETCGGVVTDNDTVGFNGVRRDDQIVRAARGS
jgi:hypothetical protein